jgi:hypothetical protein
VIHTSAPVTPSPTAAQASSNLPFVNPPSGSAMGVDRPVTEAITSAMPRKESTPVTSRPLYRACMMLPFGPSLTKYVPTTEVSMHTPPMASGSIMARSRVTGSAKKIAASSMVATMVTA